MTFAVIWVVLAAMVTVLAILRRSSTHREQGEVQVGESGRAFTLVAVVYSLVLVAGFLYIGWQHGLELIK